MLVKNPKKLPEMARKGSKIAQNGEKIGRKSIFGFSSPQPPPKNGLPKKNVVKNQKNQSCSKLPEMATKLVEIIVDSPPHKKIIIMGCPKKNGSKMKK